MNFHARVSGDRALELPLAMSHFCPWFTVRADDFPLPPEEARHLGFQPAVEPMRHWKDSRSAYHRTHLHVPEIGAYDSRDPWVIEWQIRVALDHGISGFIVNWYGKHSVENVITLHWLRALRHWNTAHADLPFLYFISFDSQAQKPTEGKQPVSMEEDFAYIRDHLISDDCLRRDGRVLFSVFPYEDNCAQWRAALDKVFGAGGADLIWMNEVKDCGENACYPWVRPDDDAVNWGNAYPWPDPDNAGTGFLRRFYDEANNGPTGLEYLMAGVWPGFDDQLVSWAWCAKPDDPRIRPRVICRETTRGNTLDLTWHAYLQYLRRWAGGDPSARLPAPLVQIVTWNDYNEASTVEPTRDYRLAPLEICRRRIAEAREIWRSHG